MILTILAAGFHFLALGIGLGAGLLTKGAAALLILPILVLFGAWNRSGPGGRRR